MRVGFRDYGTVVYEWGNERMQYGNNDSGNEKTVCRRRFSLSTMWFLVIELRLAGLAAGAFAH